MNLLLKVMLRVSIFLLVFNVIYYCSQQHNSTPKKEKPAPKLSSIVRLVDAEGNTFCSGTVITRHTILTAAHCVIERNPVAELLGEGPRVKQGIEIRTNSNYPTGVYGEVYYANGQTDHALIKGDFFLFDLSPYNTDVKSLMDLQVQNKQFISCGYPLYGSLFCNKLYFYDLTFFMWYMDGLILPGMSGGPVMTPDGTVVGTNTAVQEDKSIISPIFNLQTDIIK